METTKQLPEKLRLHSFCFQREWDSRVYGDVCCCCKKVNSNFTHTVPACGAYEFIL